MNIEDLAQKHKDDFPGYQLADFYDAAFPSYVLQLQVLMEIQRSLPTVQEFILRAIDAGQGTIEEIASLLGLEWDIVRAGVDDLQRRRFVSLLPQSGASRQQVHMVLTVKGRSALTELLLREPEVDNLSLCMDGLTGQYYPSRPLRQSQDVRKLDFHEIPNLLPVPKQESLDRMAMKRIVHELQRETEHRKERRELLDVMAVEKQWTGYRIMRILQYVRPADGEIQVEVFDGNERSPGHEEVLLQMEKQKYRPLRAHLDVGVPPTDLGEAFGISADTIEAAKLKATEVPKLQQELDARAAELVQEKAKLGSRLVEERQEASHSIELLTEQINKLQERLHQLETAAGANEGLQTYEHRPKLLEALQTAKQRVIIVSPWLNSQAVDYELRQEISRTLGRGVEVSIGYGFGDSGIPEQKTVEKLEQVARGKKGKLRLYRVGDVHSKVLICDDRFMVITSFNWFSFAGDPKRGNRVEDGILTRDKAVIATKTQQWLERFAATTQKQD